MPPGAAAVRVCRLEPRLAGADDPKRITPPAPLTTSAVTDATSLSWTGTTRVCSASRDRLQLASMLVFAQAFGVGGDVDGVGVGPADVLGPVDAVGLVDAPGSAQAARIEVAAAMARRPGVVGRTGVIRAIPGNGAEPPSPHTRRPTQNTEPEHEIRRGAPGRDGGPATRAGDRGRGLRLGRSLRVGGGLRRRLLDPAGGEGGADNEGDARYRADTAPLAGSVEGGQPGRDARSTLRGTRDPHRRARRDLDRPAAHRRGHRPGDARRLPGRGYRSDPGTLGGRDALSRAPLPLPVRPHRSR